MTKSSEINMCEGPILPSILRFALPLMLSNILQLLFNAADVVVVGRFSGSEALAAVGSTTQLINLFVNFFIGLSVGVNVMVAHYYGAGDKRGISETVHTAICIAVICGVVMLFVGILAASPMLKFMNTPDNVFDQAALYMRIYFLGTPAFVVYNFGAAIMRAAGDTRRPLIYLTISGVLNVILNVFFVVALKLDVAGVALATIISQYVSAILILRHLMRTNDNCRLVLKEIRIYKNRFSQIMQIGLGAGFQTLAFAISNVQIQSSINSFGSIVMAGSSAAGSVEGFVETPMNAVAQTALSFMGQNMGAKKYKRIDTILYRCLGLTTVIGLALGIGAYFFGEALVSIYNSDPAVIQAGVYRLSIISTTYVLCGLMEVLSFGIRGLGYSAMPMIVTLLGACALRIIWILIVFTVFPTQFTIYISYPISWIITTIAHWICYRKVRKKFPSEDVVTA